MLRGHQGGRKIISGGRTGTPRQSHWPNRASQIFVKTRAFGTPPADSTNSRARRIAGSAGGGPDGGVVGGGGGELQREVRLDGRVEVGRAFVEDAPAAIVALLAAQVVR